MKYFKTVFLAFSAVLTCCLAGCETPDQPDNQDPKPVAVESVSLSSQSLELKVGESATLTATIKPSNAQATVNWSTSNAAVATVSSGKVTAVAEGTTTISASADGKSATCQVTVKSSTPPVVEVTSVTLDRHELSLKEGESTQLKATVKPDNATDKTVSWSTSNPAIVTVDKDGNVTAVAEGSATVAAAHGNLSDACKITVTAQTVAVSSVTLNKTSLALTEQETFQLTATVSPGNATDKTVTWSSSNPAVATVSDNGLVTAKAEGSASITAKAGEKTATCTVTVAKKIISVLSITLNKTSLALTEQETFQLTATVSPDNATDKTVTWSSSNPAVATVSNSGLVTAKAEGSATITAKAGEKTATCTVTVASSTIPVDAVYLNKLSLSLTENETYQLSAAVTPDNATDKTITWSSSNAAVATVSNSGLVTAVKEGTATITAKSGGKTATCAVTVTRTIIPITSITFDDTWFYVEIDHSMPLPYTVTPADANEPIVWSSSSPSCVSIDQNGVVTGKKVGAVTITAQTANVTATCKVSGCYFPTGITLNATTLSMETGDQFQMKGTVNKRPEDTSNYGITWSSSNSSVASISSDGLITANAPGTTTIRAATWMSVSSTCTVTVTKKVIAVSSVSLNKTSLSLMEQETYQLVATVSPADATDKTVTWTSSNSSVATVDGNGVVKGVAVGSATITAKAGDKTASCAVTITPQVIPVTSVVLDYATYEIARGKVFTLTATVLPENATNKTVTWSTSNKAVATVDKNGNVTAVKAGTATITATVGSLSASCVVTVVVPVTSIVLNITSKTLKENETVKLTATVKPTDATDPSVTWASDKPHVATVDNNGTVTAVSEGVATITATAGDMTATCAITVSNTASGGHEGTGTEIWD